jgi:hypothetical protein
MRQLYHFRTDIDRLIDQILLEEPLISESRKPQLKKLIESKYSKFTHPFRVDRKAAGKLRIEVYFIQSATRALTASYKLRLQQVRRQIYYRFLRSHLQSMGHQHG